MALVNKAYLAEKLYELTIDGNPTGVKWTLRSTSCEAARAIERELQEGAMATALLSGGEGSEDERQKELSKDVLMARLAGNERIYAACVAGWDWNGEEFLEGEGSPEFSYDNVLAILTHAGGIDIKNQIIAEVDKLGKQKAASKKKR